jgi:SAM-dependent methyltransferase
VAERFDPATMDGEIVEAEHLARYRWVSSIASGRRVLDAGCGLAYGAVILAEAGASEVVGVDCASEVLDSVRADMPFGVILEEGDVTELPYANARFDLIVCFEVIEHLDNPDRALDEFHRILTDGGVLAVSSPNREVYPPGNPHHLHEYTPGELEEVLSRRFNVVRLERQHTWIVSGVLDDERLRVGDDQELGRPLRVRKVKPDRPGAELYTVALASNRALPNVTATFELAAAIELRKWDALWHEQDERLKQQAELLSEQEQMLADDVAYKAGLWREINALRVQLATAEVELAQLPALHAQAHELLQLNDAFQQLDVARSERYNVLVQSRSWKLTRPLRNIVAVARKLSH